MLLCGRGWAAPAPSSLSPTFATELAERAPVFAAATTQLFGTFTAFTAEADLRVLDQAGVEVFSGPVTYSRADLKARIEADLAKATSAKVPAKALTKLQQLGAGSVVAIARLDQPKGYALYPALGAYAEVPLPAEVVNAALAGTNATLQKTSLGNETIAGHPCVKNATTVMSASGPTLAAIVWNATDLQNFPIQIQYSDSRGIATVTFQRVTLAPPASSLFDVPGGYTQYTKDTVPADLKAAAKDALKKALGK